MANEIITKTVKLRRIDDEIFQTEGIIERLQVDAREILILATGHYKLATGEKLKVKKKQEVKPVKTDNGESVVPDVSAEPVKREAVIAALTEKEEL
jgi:hypothetical protein